VKIEVRGVRKVYPSGKVALASADLLVETPAFIGLLGPNGAGKTTLMKLITAGLLPTSGEIAVDGEPLLRREKWLKQRLGYLPQEYGLFEELTVTEYLGYLVEMKALPGQAAEHVDRAITLCNLQDKRRSRIRTLSGGFKQRVALAQAMLGSPELIVLDEPTSGLDPEERLSFRNRFSETAADKIVILSTHIIEDIQSVCNRLVVLWGGRILFDGAPETLSRQADGHVGTCETADGRATIDAAQGIRVTSRVVTTTKIFYRLVAEKLPSFAAPVQPTLEDAYIYLCSREEQSA
jgi:ABC-2 type transport system ATP-binding protein